MVIASPARANHDCGNALLPPTFTALAGTNTVTMFAFGSLPLAPSLVAGSSCTITLDVITEVAGNLENTTDSLLAGGVDVGKAAATLEVVSNPLEIIKKFIDNPAPPGSSTTLEFTLSNFNRSFAATGVSFTDDLDATLTDLTYSSLLLSDCGGTVGGVGTGLISLTGGTIPAEGTCTIRTEVSVPVGAVPGEYLNTSSTISAMIDGASVFGNVANDTLFAEPIPLFTKEFKDNPVLPSGTTELEFTITNTSTTSSATDITFEDIFDDIIGTASVVVPPNSCGVGSSVIFTPKINLLPPDEVIPARLILQNGLLAPAGSAGDSCTFSIMLNVISDAQPGVYANITSPISATVDGDTRVGEPATDTLTIIAAPKLRKTFSDDPVAPGSAVTLEFTLEHSLNATGPATGITFTDDLTTVLAGLTANLPVSPDPPCGAGSALSGSVSDTLLTFTGGELAPGESCTFSVTLDVPSNAASGSFTNITGGISGVVLGIPVTSAPATDDLSVAGLVFSKDFIDNPVLPGDVATLRFTIENIDPVNDATVIQFTDSLSTALSGLAAMAPLPVDPCGAGSTISGSTLLIFVNGEVPSLASCTFDVQVTIPAGAADGTYVNTTSSPTATIGGTGPILFDPATAELLVNKTRLSVIKSFTDDPVRAGDSVTLEFMLTNLDDTNAASAIGFIDNLDAALTGLTFDSVELNDCGATVAGTGTTLITVTSGSLLAGASCLIRVALTVPGSAVRGIYTNTSSALDGTINGFGVTGQAASDDLSVTSFDVTFTKEFDDNPVQAGGSTTLTFSLTNNDSSEPLSQLAFNDDLNGVITGLQAANLPINDVCGIGSVLSGTDFLTMTGGSLAANGGTCTFGVTLDVPLTAVPGVFPNTTSALSSSGEEAAEPATDDLVINPTPPLFSKAFMPALILTDEISVLRFDIDNSASSVNASSLDFTDNVPAGLVVAGAPNVLLSCTGGVVTAASGTSIVSYTGGTVASGAVCSISVDISSSLGGLYGNTTEDLTSSSGNSGTATATLEVDDDADDDTVINAIDNCPLTPNTNQADLDLDGLGNVCDSDDDGDGMPDDFEIENGLDPLNSFDQLADNDGDGFTNLDEFRFGTDPNVANADLNGNGVPDEVDQRRRIIPPLIYLLLLSDREEP